jgi:hypothetical protein
MKIKLLDEEVEKQLSNEIIEEKSATGWQVKATRDDMGDHGDLLICKKNFQ